ncbi:MAG TPA: hypothetical protein VMG12_39770, partial [Polyangiaceae bacterium]|nr:hypothetical protein [Polyangiaceae bacterium]
FVEGNPDDFAKPFTVNIEWINGADGMPRTNTMSTRPSYGGCGRCHNPSGESFPPAGTEPGTYSPDLTVVPTGRIGRAGYAPGADNFDSIDDELNYAACVKVPRNPDLPARTCDRLIEKYGAASGSAAE